MLAICKPNNNASRHFGSRASDAHKTMNHLLSHLSHSYDAIVFRDQALAIKLHAKLKTRVNIDDLVSDSPRIYSASVTCFASCLLNHVVLSRCSHIFIFEKTLKRYDKLDLNLNSAF